MRILPGSLVFAVLSQLRGGAIDAWKVFRVFLDLASIHSGSDMHEELRREQARRALRPEVTDTFRDDIEIDPARSSD